MEKLKKLLMNNLVLKLISVIIALGIWLMVVNIDDPVTTQTYRSVPVKVTNSGYIESMNKAYQIDDSDSTVTVVLKGKRSMIKNRQQDIVAEADLTQIIDLNSDPVMVPVTVSCAGIEEAAVTVMPGNIPVTIENVASVDPMISVSTGGTAPEVGYEVGEMRVNPEKVVITGPESIVGKIDRVVAEVDVEGMARNATKQVPLKIYDKNKEELKESQKSYLKFSTGSSSVSVDISLWEVRDGVKLSAEYTGGVPAGYQVSETTTTPEVVAVAGSQEALEKLQKEGNVIEIPAEELTENDKYEWSLDLTEYLPDDIKLATDVSNRVQVKAVIIPEGSRSLNLSVTNLEVENLSSEMNLAYDEKQIVINVRASDAILNNLTVADIHASIDLAGLEEGGYTVPVNIVLPEGYTVVEEVKIGLHLTEKEKAEES